MTRLIVLFLLFFATQISAQSMFWTTACASQSFCVDPGGCAQGHVMMTEKAGTACPTTTDISYSYKIDLQNNGSVDIQSEADTATGAFVKGTHRITWRATDNCGHALSCSYLFTIKDCTPPSMFCLNGSTQTLDAPACTGTFRASQFVLSYSDNCTPQDQIQLGIRRLGAGTGFPTDTSVSFTTCDQGLHTLEVWCKDANGLTNQCNTYVLVQDGAGGCECVTDADVTVPGCVRTSANARLSDYQLRLTLESLGGTGNPVRKSVSKNTVDSCFSITAVKMPVQRSYLATLQAFHFGNPLNGVSTYDLVQISKHILGIIPLANAYQGIAADVNNSHTITGSDIVETRKLILGIYDSFPGVPSWRLIRPLPNPADFGALNAVKDTYQLFIPTLTTDLTLASMPFIAVKTGDVNLSAMPLNGESESRGAPLSLSVTDRQLEAGEAVAVPVRWGDPATLAGWQLALRTDPTALEITGVEGLPDEDYLRSADGSVRALWFDGRERSFAAGDILFTLKVKALHAVRLSRILQLNEADLAPEAYAESTQRRPLALHFDGQREQALFLPPQPNPFAEETTFRYRLGQAGDAALELFDENGRLIYRQTTPGAVGENTLSVPASSLPHAGVYAFRLRAGGQVFAGRLVRM